MCVSAAWGIAAQPIARTVGAHIDWTHRRRVDGDGASDGLPLNDFYCDFMIGFSSRLFLLGVYQDSLQRAISERILYASQERGQRNLKVRV